MITAELQAKSPNLQTRIHFNFVHELKRERGSELKFSRIDNIHSPGLTISQQWERGMTALDGADIQLWWIEWRLSVHNAVASSLLGCLFLAHCLLPASKIVEVV